MEFDGAKYIIPLDHLDWELLRRCNWSRRRDSVVPIWSSNSRSKDTYCEFEINPGKNVNNEDQVSENGHCEWSLLDTSDESEGSFIEHTDLEECIIPQQDAKDLPLLQKVEEDCIEEDAFQQNDHECVMELREALDDCVLTHQYDDEDIILQQDTKDCISQSTEANTQTEKDAQIEVEQNVYTETENYAGNDKNEQIEMETNVQTDIYEHRETENDVQKEKNEHIETHTSLQTETWADKETKTDAQEEYNAQIKTENDIDSETHADKETKIVQEVKTEKYVGPIFIQIESLDDIPDIEIEDEEFDEERAAWEAYMDQIRIWNRGCRYYGPINLKKYMMKLHRNNPDLNVRANKFGGVTVSVGSFRLNLPEENFHSFHTLVYCRVCQVMVENVHKHKRSKGHVNKLSMPFHNLTCLRYINRKLKHCVLCNEVVEDPSAHLADREHMKKFVYEMVDCNRELLPGPGTMLPDREILTIGMFSTPQKVQAYYEKEAKLFATLIEKIENVTNDTEIVESLITSLYSIYKSNDFRLNLYDRYYDETGSIHDVFCDPDEVNNNIYISAMLAMLTAFFALYICECNFNQYTEYGPDCTSANSGEVLLEKIEKVCLQSMEETLAKCINCNLTVPDDVNALRSHVNGECIEASLVLCETCDEYVYSHRLHIHQEDVKHLRLKRQWQRQAERKSTETAKNKYSKFLKYKCFRDYIASQQSNV